MENANIHMHANEKLESYDRKYAIVRKILQHKPDIIYADLKRRMGAYLVDLLIVAATFTLLKVILFLNNPNYHYIFWLNLLFVFSIWIFYYGFFESSLFQATPGKILFKLRVINKHGLRIGFARSSLRFIASFFSILPVGLGIWDLESARGSQAWHDRLSGCYVIMYVPDNGENQIVG
jgi:uncharacterized RDD family membrane protein YckC